MANEHIKSEIDLYLSGALPEARRREIEAHAEGCEKCRQALAKARNKQARQKREALKHAYPNRVPNLLVTRLGRQAGLDRRPSRAPYGWLGMFLLVGAALVLIGRREGHRPWFTGNGNSPAGNAVAVSSGTQTVPGAFDVTQGTQPAAAMAPATSPAASAAVKPSSATARTLPEKPQTWSGADSGVKEARQVAIRGRAAWRALWTEMQPDGTAPRVNFNEWMVAGAFAGERPAGTQITLLPAHEEDEAVILAFKVTSAPVAPGESVGPTHPYALITLPRSDKPVRVVPVP